MITVYDYWYVWIRPVIIGIVGIITLLSAVLFHQADFPDRVHSGGELGGFGHPGGSSLDSGRCPAVLERVVREPHKVFLVPVIILVLSIMSAIRKK
ncbi:MAG: hypothetical protein ACOX0J_11205 [Thermoactinomyces vulgaris]